MVHDYLSGIQQIGTGVSNAENAMHLYKEVLGMDVLVFNDVAKASLTTHYFGIRKSRIYIKTYYRFSAVHFQG